MSSAEGRATWRMSPGRHSTFLSIRHQVKKFLVAVDFPGFGTVVPDISPATGILTTQQDRKFSTTNKLWLLILYQNVSIYLGF